MKIAIVTGGSSGIGRATARELARRGMGVLLTYNSSRSGADQALAEIAGDGGHAMALPLDVSVAASFPAFVATALAAVREHWGADTFDVLVNNAGWGMFTPFAQVSEQDFDGLFRVHLKGPFFLTQALLPHLAPGASIVNLTSGTTRVTTPGCAPYASFKGGLVVLTRYLAKELASRKLRVNSISPGPIETNLADGALRKTPGLAESLAADTALGRMGQPEDVALAIAALCSESGQWITGQDIEVSGGYAL